MVINEATIRMACEELADLLIAKNRDYGNSVEEQFKEYGLTSGLIRLDDKMRRLKNLKDQTSMNVKEPLKDTVIDLSGYAVLLTILLKSEDVPLANPPVYMKHDLNFNPHFDQDDQH